MSRKTELTELHKKGKDQLDPASEWGVSWYRVSKLLREEASKLRAAGDKQMASYLKQWAQRLEK